MTAAADKSVSRSLAFDENVTVTAQIIWGGAGAEYSLTDEGGSELSLHDFRSEVLGPDGSLDTFEITAPPTGPIALVLKAGSADAKLNYSFFFSNERRLLVETTPTTVNAGSMIHIAARIVEGDGRVLMGRSSSFSATVRKPDLAFESVALLDDGAHGDAAAGDGIFGASFGSTSLQGNYALVVEGTHDFGSYQVARSGEGGFVVSPTGGAFSGPITDEPLDLDGDGLYDQLKFKQRITLSENGHFRVIADLMDAEGRTIAILPWSFRNTEGPGVAIAELSVSGAVLSMHRQDGPWTLSNVRLVREDLGSLELASAADHVTQSYSVSKFNPPPPPAISMVIPDSGTAGGGYEITITGTGLYSTTEVFVDGQVAQFTMRDDSSLGVIIPSTIRRSTREGESGTTGSSPIAVDVRVLTPWSETVAHAAFQYEL